MFGFCPCVGGTKFDFVLILAFTSRQSQFHGMVGLNLLAMSVVSTRRSNYTSSIVGRPSSFSWSFAFYLHCFISSHNVKRIFPFPILSCYYVRRTYSIGIVFHVHNSCA